MRLIDSLRHSLERFGDRRSAPRMTEPSAVAYLWNGGQPVPRRIKDLSHSGTYLYTEERWYPGTMLQVTLDLARKGEVAEPLETLKTMTIWCKVIRSGPDGVALQFIFTKRARWNELKRFVAEIGSVAS